MDNVSISILGIYEYFHTLGLRILNPNPSRLHLLLTLSEYFDYFPNNLQLSKPV